MNRLFYGDNLDILRQYIPNESVDLIYLDPPFNSNRNYNVLFSDESGLMSDAQIVAFEDTWHWGPTSEVIFRELVMKGPERVSSMIESLMKLIGRNQMMAYLVMMTVRLIELRRVLKPTGSIYLHCDTTASHYLRIIMDSIFGIDRFLNEITWKRTTAHNDPQRFGRIQDRILFYSKTANKTFHYVEGEYSEKQLSRYKYEDEKGRFRAENLTAPDYSPNRAFEWRGTQPGAKRHWRFSVEELEKLYQEGRILLKKDGTPRKDGHKIYLHEAEGPVLQDIWADIQLGPTSAERLGYPTQKPLKLLERIIETSSNPGDIVLDPFCGCGTAVAAAQKLGRQWIGIDITHLSIAMMKYRLSGMFDLKPGVDYEVIGEPTTLAGARQLALEDRYQFQFWAGSLVQAKPIGGEDIGSRRGKKGKDRGIDGIINFFDNGETSKSVLLQVKSGKVKSSDIRDLIGTVDREKAAIGVFITLENPTKDMETEALSAGFYESPVWGKQYPKIQIFTVEQLLNGAQIDMPPQHGTFKQAERVKKNNHTQPELF